MKDDPAKMRQIGTAPHRQGHARLTKMNRLTLATCVSGMFLAISSQASGQVQFSERWAGTWRLDVEKSTFGPILFPGTPRDMLIAGQTLKIERVDKKIRLSGETAVKLAGNVIINPEDTSLDLNGDETNLGPGVPTFWPIHSSEFEIRSRMQVNSVQYLEVSRFVSSADGKTLTETKILTRGPDPADKVADADSVSASSSTTVLIFTRIG